MIDFISSNPWDFSDELIDVIAKNPKITRNIPAINTSSFVSATWIDVKVCPIAEAKIPSIMKISEKPAKKTNVIFVISFLSLKV